MPNLDSIKEPDQGASYDDAIAKSELQSFELDSWHSRHRKRTIHKMFIVAIYGIFVIAGLILLTRVYHYIFPPNCHWLEIDQLRALDGMLTTSIIGGLIGKYFDRIMEMLNSSKEPNI